MSILHDRIQANLRTTCLTLAGAFLLQTRLTCQPLMLASVTSQDVLSPWEAMASPLAEIRADLAVVAAPRPFGLSGLSEGCLVLGLPPARLAVALSARSTSSISMMVPELRYRFEPMDGYGMGLRVRSEWMIISGFDDHASLSIDLSASMRMAEWTLAVGLDRAIDLGQVRGPTLRMGLARDMDTIGMMIDVVIAWNRPASLRIASLIELTPRIPLRLALSTFPITIECALRVPVSTTTKLLMDLRHSDPLGAATALTFIMDIP